MQSVTRSIFVLCLVGFFTVASAQLPPEIMVDKHLIHADQLYAAKDYAKAINVMEKIIALQKEHSLTLSDEFHFKYAQVALAADSTRIALESVIRYLSATGDEGEFYKEALALMLKAEGNEVMTAEDFYNEVIKTQGTCQGLPKGSKCWMELTNHPECYVWNDDLSEGETATWTGQCSDHLPDGKGTLTWYHIYEDEDSKQKKQKKLQVHTGTFQKGKKQGHWTVQYYYLNVERVHTTEEGSYVDDKRHSHWVKKEWHGSVASDYALEEGPYVDGKRHGQWVVGWYDSVENKTDISHEGPYVDGKKHGQWIIHESGWALRYEESYVDGKKHGQWVVRRKDGIVYEYSYMDGKPHGQWVIRYPDGIVGGGSHVDGKKHGEWLEGSISDKDKGRYVNGEKEGTWLSYDKTGCWAFLHRDGTLGVERAEREKCRQAGLIP